MASSRQLSTDPSKDVYIQPGWYSDFGPVFVDMGDGIVASCMMMERRIIDRATDLDTTLGLYMGRRLVAFRINDRCEVQEIGPPTICPGDIQYYYDDTWIGDTGDPTGDTIWALDGSYDDGGLAYMGNDVVVAIGTNGYDPVFTNPAADTIDNRASAAFELMQCFGWAARLNRTDLTWEVGPRTHIVRHYYTTANTDGLWDGGMQGVARGFGGQTVGVAKISDAVAVVSAPIYEYGLAHLHLDLPGIGDYTDEGISRDVDSFQQPISEEEITHIRLSALSVDHDALTIQVINQRRITDRVSDGYFLRCDQPYSAGAGRGVLIFSRPNKRGHAVVWRHDASGAISGFTTSEWMAEGLQQYLSWATPTTMAEYYALVQATSDRQYELRTDYDNLAHRGYDWGTAAKISENLFAAVGNERNFFFKFLVTMRLNEDDTFTKVDHKPLPTDENSVHIVPVGRDGWVWIGARDVLYEEPGPEIDGYTRQGSYNNMPKLNMTLVHVNLAGEIDDYVALGTGFGYGRYKDSDYLAFQYNHTHYLGGRGWVAESNARSFRYGDDHVLIGNLNSLAIMSPLTQSFPVTRQGRSNPLLISQQNIWYEDLTNYSPESTAQETDRETRVSAYGGPSDL